MTQQQRSIETRNRILSVAARLFARHGYNATGIAEICQQANVSKGAFYHHFDGKQTMFLELLNAWQATIEQGLQVIAQETLTVPQSLLKMARLMQSVLESNKEQIPVFLEFWMLASRDRVVRRLSLAPYQRYLDFFADLIRRGVAEGSLEPVDPLSGAQALISLASGLFLQGALDPKGSDWGQVTADSIQILLNGLGRRQA